jgi:fumarylacetoacetase
MGLSLSRVVLPNGERRAFLQDDDEISFRGRCDRPGYATIGFGSCIGRIETADVAGIAKKA